MLHTVFVSFLVASCLAIPLTDNHVVHERQGSISRGWKRALKLEQDVKVPVRIGLKQRNIHESYKLLMDVYVVIVDKADFRLTRF
jgi:tripeptidyl-peptidase I